MASPDDDTVYEEEICDERMMALCKQTFSYNDGLIKVHPYNTIYPRGYVKYDELIRSTKIYDDDVWITSYPKSGTRWMKEIVWLLQNDLDYEQANTSTLSNRAPFFDLPFIMGMEYETIGKDHFNIIDNMRRPRVINTHLSYDMLPRQLIEANSKAKIVVVMRNPRDVCSSFFNHLKITAKYSGTMETLTDAFLADVAPYCGPYFVMNLSYWRQKHKSNIFIVHYEEMQHDLQIVIKRLANFLNVSISDEEIPNLCDHVSFDNMKKNPMLNFENKITEMKKKMENTMEGSMVNKGKSGNWKETFNEETIKRFEEWEAKWLKDSDMKIYLDENMLR